MRLLRYGEPGSEKPAMMDEAGTLRDLSAAVDDIDGDTISPAGLARLRALDAGSLPVIASGVRIGPCVGTVGKFVCIGLNYSDHAAEAGMAAPHEPIIFLKANSAISGPNDDIVIPRGSSKTDWEVELGVVIGTRASYVEESRAMEHVAGYCLVNDVSEREYQLERQGTWDKGKGCDSFGPIGPWLVTSDEIADPQALDMFLDVNGFRKQTGNTRTMIFGVAFLISYVSRFMTLLPGDIIATGTPSGVGMGMKPPQFLRAGDVVRLGIEHLGEQLQHVRAHGAHAS